MTQTDYIILLYEQLGQTPEDDIERLTAKQKSERIDELKALKDKREHQGEWKKEDWWEG